MCSVLVCSAGNDPWQPAATGNVGIRADGGGLFPQQQYPGMV